MIGSFYKELKVNETNRKIPQTVIDELSKKLPSGYKYSFDKKRKHLIVKADSSQKTNLLMNININYEEAKIPPSIPKERIPEYLYRTQKAVKLNDAVIKRKGKELKIENINVDPLSGEGKDEKIIQYLTPQEFPPAAPMTFRLADGTEQKIMFRRQPYESFEMVKFSNETFPALKIDWIINERSVEYDKSIAIRSPSLKISVNPREAETVTDAVIALKIFKGYIDGTLTMEDIKIGRNLSQEANIDIEALNEQLQLWKDLKSLEDVMKIKIVPSIDFTEEERILFYEFKQMFLMKQDVIYKEPFDHFHLGVMKFSGKGMSEKDLIGKKNMTFTYINELKDVAFHGARFKLYETVMLSGFTIVDVVKDDSSSDSGCEIFIQNTGDKQWSLSRRYSLTYDDAKKHSERMRTNR